MSKPMPAGEDPRAIPDPSASEPGLTHSSGAGGSGNSLIASLLADQRRRWRQGERVRVEEYLGQHPALQADAEAILDLIYNEMVLQEQAEGLPSMEDYVRRFPQFATQIRHQLEVHHALGASQLSSDAQPAASLPPLAPDDCATEAVAGPPPSRPAIRIRCPHCHNPILVVDDRPDEVLCPGCGSSFRIREARQTTATALTRPLGKFQLLERVGLGTFGAVWRAKDTELDRVVALKIPHTGVLTTATELERFNREARAAAQLRHPGIVTVHEVQILEGLPTIVADFIDGVPLKDLMQVRRLNFREVATLVADVGEALDYAHSLGLVHRDIKPANIMVESVARGPSSLAKEQGAATADYGLRTTDYGLKPLIMDFGLALRQEAEVTMTLDGHVLGTPAYMSPEQAAGKGHQADRRSDVYSLGVILYELLTGELPFRGSKTMILHQVMHEEPQRPRRLNDKIPRDLETICLKTLAKQPSRRYATARALADDLRRFLKGEPIRARRVGPFERAVRWAKRKPAAAALLAVSACALASLFGGGLWYNQQLEIALADTTRAEEDAEHQRDDARQAEQTAKRQRDEARWNLYRANISLAQKKWEDGDIRGARQLLDTFRPRSNEENDLRAFEWYYLWRLCHSELLTLKHGTFPITSVAFSPDGKRVASYDSRLASRDGQVKIWDASTGRPSLALTGRTPEGREAYLCFSHDGKRIACGSASQKVRIWDALTGQELATLKGFGATYSADDKLLATGSWDGTVTVYDVSSAKELFVLKGEAGIHSTAFSPDGRYLAAASVTGGGVTLWELATRQEMFTLRRHQGGVSVVVFSPDGRLLASAALDQSVDVWDASNGRSLRSLRGHTDMVESVAFSPDGTLLASASADHTIKLWDVKTGKNLRTLRGHTGRVWDVAFNPKGDRLASAGDEGVVKIWDPSRDQESRSLEVFGGNLSPDGMRLAVERDTETLQVLDALSGRKLLTLKKDKQATMALAFSHDGGHLACGSQSGSIWLWDASTGAEVRRLAGDALPVRALAFSPDDRLLASASGHMSGYAAWNVRTWDLSSGQKIVDVGGSDDWVAQLLFSPDGKSLAVAKGMGTVDIRSASTGQILKVQRGRGNGTGIAYSSDGRRVALSLAGSADGQVRIWDTATGQELHVLKEEASRIHSVAFSPDGKRLATCNHLGMLKLWSTETGEELLRLKDAGWVATFTPDGKQIATVGAGKPVRLWDAGDPGHLLTWNTSESRTRDTALALLEPLFTRLVRRSDVSAALRADSRLSDPLRRDALALADHYVPEPGLLEEASRNVVRTQGAGHEAYRRALLQAEEAHRLVPDAPEILNTLGVAQYRAGEYQDAVETLTRCDKLHSAGYGGTRPSDIAFLAMAQHQLGQMKKSQESLGRLREIMKYPQWVGNEQARSFLREAVMLIEGTQP